MWTFWCSLGVLFFSASVQSGLGLNPSNKCTTALGLEDLRIQDSQLTALSYYESLSIGGGKAVDTEPKCARLNHNSCAWCAPRGNGQYLQVDLRHDFIITGIATQGFEALRDYYVRRYKVSHSRNGHTWSTFPGVMRVNHDGRSVVRHNFRPPVYARYIRVYPMAYRYRICMRMELYGCINFSSALSTTPSSTSQRGTNNATPENVPPTTRTTAASNAEKPMLLIISHSASECSGALGLEDLRIQDSQLTAQSYYKSLSIGGGRSVGTEPKCGRLNHNSCAWCAPRGNGQYLQLDLRGDFTITGIATQGFEALSDYYVRRYKVSHSRDGYTWSTSPGVMRGNHDGRSVVRHNFRPPVYARYTRVYPMAYRYRICMRMELYGCINLSSALSTTPSSTTQRGTNNTTPENVPPTTRTTAASNAEKPMLLIISHSTSECSSALGLEDLRIQDSQLTAQSYYKSLSIGGGKSVDSEPKCGRLNKNNCAWCATHGNGQYLQVDLRRDFIITGIATQGFEALSDYYVRRYKVSHSRDGHTWSTELMKGNHDGKSVVRHNFISPVYGRYIRVYPMAYRNKICMRLELYGCSNSSSVLNTTPSPTNQSGSNSTTPENVPSTTRTTAASSFEKPMMIHSTAECNTALGLEDLRIDDSQLTAQSHYESLSIGGGKSVDTEPKCARLNHNSCAWCAPRGNGQYLQVDLRRDFIITGIATQGFEALRNYYVRRYKVSHSRNGHAWSTFPVMRGNHDGRSVVRHTFSSQVYARYIKVYPVAYRYRICMRMELYGCSYFSSVLSTTPSRTNQSGANNTTPENVSPTSTTTAASSTEKPMIIHSTTGINKYNR